MKRKFVLVLLALVMVFGSVSVVSAYGAAGDVYTNRTSNTSANVAANILYSTTVDTCTIKLTLQEKYNGSWRTATNVPVKTVSKTAKNGCSFTLVYKFTLAKGKVYRIKANFSSKAGSSSLDLSRYTGSF